LLPFPGGDTMDRSPGVAFAAGGNREGIP
jgi:hypothetical protein